MAVPLPVISYVSYYTDWSNKKPTKNPELSDALNFVKAIKNKKSFAYTANVPICGTMRQLTWNDRDKAYGWAGELMATYLNPIQSNFKARVLKQQFLLVPVPSGSCLSANDVLTCRTARLCQEIASRVPRCDVAPAIWWNRPVASAQSGGGNRSEPEKVSAMTFAGKALPKNTCYVLVDDNVSTGSTLRAVSTKFTQKLPSEFPRFVLALSRTVRQDVAAFETWQHDLSDFPIFS